MLQTIRDHTQGWIAGIIISIIIFTFALWGIHSYFISGADSDTVAEVNGVPISKNQLSVTYERLLRQSQAYNPNQTSINEAELRKSALDALVEIQVLRQAALDENFRVSAQQVNSYLESMPEFQIKGQFSLQRFQDILSAAMLSTGEFLGFVETNLLIEQPKLGILFTSFALPSEVQNEVKLVNQERDFLYLIIPQSHFSSKNVNITDQQIADYYEQNKSTFSTPEQVSIEYLQLSAKDLMAQIQPSEESLRKFYDNNLSSFARGPKWRLAIIQLPLSAQSSAVDVAQANLKASELLQKIKAGADFSKLAHVYSPELNRTLQGLVSTEQLPTDLQKTVAGMTKPGQVVGPIQTDKGVMLIKALDILPATTPAFAQVKSQVTEVLRRQAGEEKFAELRDKLSNITYEHPDTLQTAAQALNLPINTTGLFTLNEGDKLANSVTKDKKVRMAAFSNDVLNLGNNSELIALSTDTVIVLRVKAHTPQGTLPLQVVSQQIKSKLVAAEAQKQAAQLAASIKQNLQAGKQLGEAAEGLKWVSSGFLGRYARSVDPAILETAFQMVQPNKGGMVYDVVPLTNGYAVVALRGAKEGSIPPKQYPIFAEQVQNSEALLEYEFYKESQMKSADIDIVKPPVQ